MYIQGNFSCKDGTIKNRDGKDLIEAEEIKKRWQEYTEQNQIEMRPIYLALAP